MKQSPRLIAFYLPQFHPIPENDSWWGKGFTEWTNVAKAKPLFPGHDQPRVPADLGFYDLRVPETRAAQAALARNAGIEGFCYWHYWFAGKRLLERPFDEVLASGEPDFPFCLGWANETWTGIWHGAPKRILIEQLYPGVDDHEKHFYSVLPAFQDRRYIRVNGKPLFLVYQPRKLPNPREFIDQWQALAQKNGLPGIHFVAHMFGPDLGYDPREEGFDAGTMSNPARIGKHSKTEIGLARTLRGGSGRPDFAAQLQARSIALRERARTLFRRCAGQPRLVFDYADAVAFFLEGLDIQPGQPIYPCAVPQWDNSPRSGTRATILHQSTPELFRTHLREVLARTRALPSGQKIVFVKSWNEWAEGNYLEPDLRFGHQYLNVVREEVTRVRESDNLSNRALVETRVTPKVHSASIP